MADITSEHSQVVINCLHDAEVIASHHTKHGNPTTPRDVLLELHETIVRDDVDGPTKEGMLVAVEGALNVYALDAEMSRPSQGMGIGF